MGGETEANISGWTTDTLNAHVRALMTEMDLRYQQRYDASSKALEAALLAAEKAVDSALEASEKAIIKAELAADKRFESVNEFRAQLADQAATFVPRTEFKQLADQVPTFLTRNEYAQAHENLKEQVMALRSLSDANMGAVKHQRIQVANIVALCAVVGMVVTVVALLWSR